MDDVFFGYVYDFGTGEEWTAVARRRRVPERRAADRAAEGRDRDPLVRGDDAPPTSPRTPRASTALAHRLRIMGSLAITLCHLAAGRVDGVVSLKPARSVDIAAASCSCASGALDRAAGGAAVRRGAARSRWRARASPRPRSRRALPGAVGRPRSLTRYPRPVPTRDADPRRARPGDRPRAAPARHRARHGARRRDRRRRGDGDDRAHGRRLPAALELPGPGRASSRRARRASRRSTLQFDVMTPDERAALTTQLRGGVEQRRASSSRRRRA